MNELSYNDIVELALKHGFEGNPRGTKKLALIEFINTNPLKEVDTVQETKDEEIKEPVQEAVVEVAPKDPAKTKKNLVVTARRDAIAQLVETTLQGLDKPIEHTKLFYKMYGEDFPKGPDANEKWRDIGNCLLALVNSGKVIAQLPEGKKRTNFAWKKDEVVEEKKEDPAPESTTENTEESEG